MEKNKIIELQNKIIAGLKIASIRLIEAKKKNNGKLVVSYNGEIKILNAADINL